MELHCSDHHRHTPPLCPPASCACRDLPQAQDEQLDERLDARARRALLQNRAMGEELRLHLQQSDHLQAEARLLEDERARLLHELDLKAQLEAGLARRGAAQAGALKAARARGAALEEALAAAARGAAKERAELARRADERVGVWRGCKTCLAMGWVGSGGASTYKFLQLGWPIVDQFVSLSSPFVCGPQVAEARGEADALRRLARLKARELARVRRLARAALLQRGAAEVFLIAALEQARAGAAAEAAARAGGGEGATEGADTAAAEGASSLSAGIGGDGSGSGDGSGVSGKSMAEAATDDAAGAAPPGALDLRAMTWAQRERVLRALFARIAAHRSAGGGGPVLEAAAASMPAAAVAD